MCPLCLKNRLLNTKFTKIFTKDTKLNTEMSSWWRCSVKLWHSSMCLSENCILFFIAESNNFQDWKPEIYSYFFIKHNIECCAIYSSDFTTQIKCSLLFPEARSLKSDAYLVCKTLACHRVVSFHTNVKCLTIHTIETTGIPQFPRFSF